VVTFIGGRDTRTIVAMKDGIDIWRNRMSCTPLAPVELAKKTTEATTRTDAKCADGSDFVVYYLPEMGHSWPGSGGPLGDTSAGLDATELMWQFFKSHPRP
jgi:polyhydroxybutyrate depolymerase